jgi:hypothetical protein
MEQRILTAPSMNFPPWDINYKCVASGEEVTSMRQRKRILDENGWVDARECIDPPKDFETGIQSRPELPKPESVPEELREAMVREDLGHMLPQ